MLLEPKPPQTGEREHDRVERTLRIAIGRPLLDPAADDRPAGRAGEPLASVAQINQTGRNDDVKRTAKQNNSSAGARSVGFDASPMWIHLPVLSVCSNMSQRYTLESSPESSGLPLLQARTLCGVSLTLRDRSGKKVFCVRALFATQWKRLGIGTRSDQKGRTFS